MNLTMLGTGHAMVTECYNTCFLLWEGGSGPNATPADKDVRRLLVDGGGGLGLLRQLKAVGLDAGDIREVFVTHRHLDHLMGVVWLLRVWTQMMLNGAMDNPVRVYGHDEVCSILANMASMLLNPAEAALVRTHTGTDPVQDASAGMEERNMGVQLVELHDGKAIHVADHTIVPFDIRSTKAKQFGFRLELEDGRWLTCCGDEPLPRTLFSLATGSEWLLHEAFCLEAERRCYPLERMHHSSVVDACRTAQELGAHSLVLYHARDNELDQRKRRYLKEGREVFCGNLFAPYDLETITLT